NLKTEEGKIGAEIEKLNIDMNDINAEIERLKPQKTEKIQAELNENQVEIERLNLKKGYIENIKLISEPEASIAPIKPKKKLNVALAGVVGFMLAVFMAFFAEYIKKSKEEDRAKERTN
ncbi:MAG: GNVR domain-containing protein, partial [Pseudomonadota bacterium]